MKKNRDIVSEARSLCDDIAGQLEDGMGNEDYRGSIEIVEVLVDEIYRLRASNEQMMQSLRVLSTWARFDIFEKCRKALTPESVIELCDKSLK